MYIDSTKLHTINQPLTFPPQEHAEARSRSLADALQAQQYYSDAQEVESWMKEKELTVGSGDYGKDEDSAQVGRRHHNWAH